MENLSIRSIFALFALSCALLLVPVDVCAVSTDISINSNFTFSFITDDRLGALNSTDFVSSNYSSPSRHIFNKSEWDEFDRELRQFTSNTYLKERICYAIACVFIIVLSLFGNLLVCKVCMQNMTKTNALIMSLAVSDLSMTIFNIPFNFFRLLDYSWPFGSVMCFVMNFVQHLVVYNSSYTMVIIAIQRYYSVCITSNRSNVRRIFAMDKCKSHYCSTRVIFATIIVIWLFSSVISTFFTFSSTVVIRKDIFTIILSMYIAGHFEQAQQHSLVNQSETINYDYNFDPPNANHAPEQAQELSPLMQFMLRCTNPVPAGVNTFITHNFAIKAEFAKSVAVFVTQYFIPLSISCCLYIRIGKTILHHRRHETFKGSKTLIQQSKKRRRIFMLSLVVAVFAICWLPINLFHMLTDAGLINYNYQLFMMVHWLAMSSVIYNPFIYCWLNKNFRKAAFRVFAFCCFKEEISLTSTVAVQTEMM